MKNSSDTSGSFRLPALTEEGILLIVVPYGPRKGGRDYLSAELRPKQLTIHLQWLLGLRNQHKGTYMDKRGVERERERERTELLARASEKENLIQHSMKKSPCEVSEETLTL